MKPFFNNIPNLWANWEKNYFEYVDIQLGLFSTKPLFDSFWPTKKEETPKPNLH